MTHRTSRFLIAILLGGLSSCNDFNSSLRSNAMRVSQASANISLQSGPNTNATNQVFIVEDNIDYGLRFLDLGKLNDPIIPEFVDEETKQKVSDFMAPDNLKLYIGKKIICNCMGDRYEKGGFSYFRVREANISAQ